MIEAQCDCGQSYRVNDELAGRNLRCKKCQGLVKVPSVDEQAVSGPPLRETKSPHGSPELPRRDRFSIRWT